MDKDKIIRLISDPSVKKLEDKDKIKRFQSMADSDTDSEKRVYFEALVFQTEIPNQQGYRWTADAVPLVVEQFKAGLPVQIMHYLDLTGKGSPDMLPLGFVVDAEGTDDGVFAQFYIRRGMTTPMGPYGNSDELIEAVFDGMAASVSPGLQPRKNGARCNLCFGNYGSLDCGHIKGETYLIENAAGQQEEKICFVELYDVELFELSIVGLGADPAARVKQQIQLSRAFGSAYDEEKKIRLQKLAEGQQIEVNEMTEQELRKREQELNERERTLIDAENAKLKAELEAKNKEIATFSAQQAENERAIKDGKIARANAIALNAEAFSKTKPDTKKAELEKQLEERALGFGIASIEEIEANTKLLVQQVTGKYNDENTDGQSALRKALEDVHKDNGNDIDEFLKPV